MPLLSEQSGTTSSRHWWRSPSTWGGALAVCGGAFHTATAALMRRDVWAQVVDEGFFGTVSLQPSADRLAVAEAFWFSPGSFGVPLLLLGCLVIRSTRRGERVPGWLGGGVAAWALLIGLLGGFDAGALALLLVGALLGVGSWSTRRPGRTP